MSGPNLVVKGFNSNFKLITQGFVKAILSGLNIKPFRVRAYTHLGLELEAKTNIYMRIKSRLSNSMKVSEI